MTGRGWRLLQKMRKLQSSTASPVPKAPFERLVRKLLAGRRRLGKGAIEAVLEASNDYLHKWFRSLNVLAEHAGRVTIMRPDALLLKRIQQRRAARRVPARAGIPKLPMARLVRSILPGFFLSSKGCEAELHKAAEIALVKRFGLLQMLATHAKRKTIQTQDARVLDLLDEIE
jgi:histone H3/H4